MCVQYQTRFHSSQWFLMVSNGSLWDHPAVATEDSPMQFQVRKAVAGAAAAAFDLEIPSTCSVNDLTEALAWDPGSNRNLKGRSRKHLENL